MNTKYLSDRELLGSIISDRAAAELLNQFRSLEDLFIHAGIEEIAQASSVGRKRATQVKAVAELARRLFHRSSAEQQRKIVNPSDVFDLCRDLQFQQQEEARAILLNTKNQVIDILTISLGGLDRTFLQPQQIFPPAMRRYSASIILAHCHPSGDPPPSQPDIESTKRLAAVGEIMSIAVLDHVVIGRGTFVSLREKGYI